MFFSNSRFQVHLLHEGFRKKAKPIEPCTQEKEMQRKTYPIHQLQLLQQRQETH